MSKTLKNLALDVYMGKNVMFNEVSGEQAIKNAILEAVNGDMSYHNFQHNKHKVFAILGEVLALPTIEREKILFPGIVGVETVAYGDKKEFYIENPAIYRTSVISAGNSDIRRQKIAGRNKITIDTDYIAIKIYEEIDRFLAGRVDFAKMIQDVAASFEVATAKMINKCFNDSFTTLRANLKVTGTIDEDKLVELCERVSAANGGVQVAIYGSSTALSKVAKSNTMVADSQKEEYATLRRFSNFFNIQLIEMPQVFDENGVATVATDKLYILPVGKEIVKVIYEGEPLVVEGDGSNRGDLQMEYFCRVKVGCGILVPNTYGMWTIA